MLQGVPRKGAMRGLEHRLTKDLAPLQGQPPPAPAEPIPSWREPTPSTASGTAPPPVQSRRLIQVPVPFTETFTKEAIAEVMQKIQAMADHLQWECEV